TINQYDEAPIGTTKPFIYYGLNAGVSFKGFDLSILLQGVENRVLYLPVSVQYSFGSNGMSQAYNGIEGRWTPETGKASTYPALTPGLNTNNDPDPFFGTNN